MFWSDLLIAGKVVSWERWDGSEHGRWERWKSSELGRWGRWEDSELGRWERWKSSEVARWVVPGFIQEWGAQGES